MRKWLIHKLGGVLPSDIVKEKPYIIEAKQDIEKIGCAVKIPMVLTNMTEEECRTGAERMITELILAEIKEKNLITMFRRDSGDRYFYNMCGYLNVVRPEDWVDCEVKQ